MGPQEVKIQMRARNVSTSGKRREEFRQVRGVALPAADGRRVDGSAHGFVTRRGDAFGGPDLAVAGLRVVPCQASNKVPGNLSFYRIGVRLYPQ